MDAVEAAPELPDARLPALLASGEAVFGIFSGEHTAEGGAAMAQLRETDFVFYSLESGPFDMPAMEAYIRGMGTASMEMGVEPHPLILRIPPIHLDTAAARDHVTRGLSSGADGIVYPHVVTPEEAALSSELMGPGLYPADPVGERVNVVLIEDQEGISNARGIVGTPGVSVAIPGPGDLRRAYEGDMEAVEEAIQTVLAACLELDVPCGITAGVDDIEERLDQGFRFIIVTQPEALAVGRAHAGR
jgi:2-keto-3-deoxy-L-rhamnonate aldolase RhmA